MNTIKDDNRVTCVSCGHVNYIKTDEISVKVLELQKSDIGLMISTKHNRGILLGYEFKFSPSNGFEGYLDIEDSLMYEDDSVREFVRDSNETIKVYRPPVR